MVEQESRLGVDRDVNIEGYRDSAFPGDSAADDPSVSQSVFTITEKATTRVFSWLKAPTSAFTFKTLLRHYA